LSVFASVVFEIILVTWSGSKLAEMCQCVIY